MCGGGSDPALTAEQDANLAASAASAASVSDALLGTTEVVDDSGAVTQGATTGFIDGANAAIGTTGSNTFTTDGGTTTVAGDTTASFNSDGELVTTVGDTKNIDFAGTEVTTAGTVMGNTDQLIGGQADLSTQINSGFANIPSTTVVTQSVDTSDLAKSADLSNLGVAGQDSSGVAGRFNTLDNSLGITDTSGSITDQLSGTDGTGGIMGGVNSLSSDMTTLGAAEGDVSNLGTRLNTVDSTLNNMGTTADTTGVSDRFGTIDTAQEDAKNAQNAMVTRLMGADEFDPNSVLGQMKKAILAGQATIDSVVDTLLTNQRANQVTNTTALGGLQTSLNNQDSQATKFNTKYDTNTGVQNAAQKQLVSQITGGFTGVGTSQMNAANNVISAGNANANAITSAQNSTAANNTTNYGQLIKDLNNVNKAVSADQQSDVVNRLGAIKQVLSDQSVQLNDTLRAQYTDLSNSFDEQGGLIQQSTSQTGNIMRRGFDESNNLVISAFDQQGGLVNQQILDMNRMFKQMESFGYNNQGDQFGDLTPNGLGLMSGGNDSPVIQQSF